MTDLKHEFWTRMDDVQAGMLAIKGDHPLIPMAPQVDDDVPGHVWFITDAGTDLAAQTAQSPQPARLVVADGAAGLYADAEGMLAQVEDKAALDEVWSRVAAAWFDEGKQDPDVRLLRSTPASAAMSVSPQSGAKFLYEIAKANVTGNQPDVGEKGHVTF